MNDDYQGFSAGTIEGMNKAVDHAEAVAPEWKLRAALFLVKFIETRSGQPFIVPTLRKWAERNGLDAPPTNMAWGGIVNRAARAGVIEHVGYEQWSDETCHARTVHVWKGR